MLDSSRACLVRNTGLLRSTYGSTEQRTEYDLASGTSTTAAGAAVCFYGSTEQRTEYDLASGTSTTAAKAAVCFRAFLSVHDTPGRTKNQPHHLRTRILPPGGHPFRWEVYRTHHYDYVTTRVAGTESYGVTKKIVSETCFDRVGTV